MSPLLLAHIVLAAALAHAQDAAGPPVTVVEAAADAEFNLEVPVTFAGDNANVAVGVRFDEQENGDRLELRIRRDELSFIRVQGGNEQGLASLALSAQQLGEQGKLDVTLRRRQDGASILLGTRRFVTIWQEATPGKLSIAAPAGVVDQQDVYYQPYAPPEFTDDFMRDEADATGEWQIVAGKWENTALVDKLKFVPRAANSFAFAAHPASPAFATAGDAFWDDYQCAVSVRAPGPGTAGLAFRAQDAANCYLLSADFGSREADGSALLKLSKLAGGTEEVLAQRACPVPTGQWYRLKVSLSGPEIDAFLDEAPIFSLTDDTFAQGPMGLYAANCDTIYFDDAEAGEQKEFADDFERYGAARWQAVQGEWQAVPAGKSGGTVLAKKGELAGLAVAGRATWTDYEYEAQVKPGGGPFGLCFYWAGPTDYWLWRVRSGKQQLVHVAGGAETVMDEAPADLPKDWSTVAIRAGKDYASVSVNGRRTVEALLPVGLAGKVGVWGDRGSRALFDNVKVTFPPGYVPATLPATMVSDAEMKEQFANPAEGWFQVGSESTQPAKVGMNWNKGEYFEPVDISFPVSGVGTAAGKVRVTIEGDQTAPGGGYDLVLSAQANLPKVHLELLRDGKTVAQGDTEIDAASGTCQVHAGRRGTYVVAYVDGKLVVAYREGHGPVGVAPAEPSNGKVQGNG